MKCSWWFSIDTDNWNHQTSALIWQRVFFWHSSNTNYSINLDGKKIIKIRLNGLNSMPKKSITNEILHHKSNCSVHLLIFICICKLFEFFEWNRWIRLFYSSIGKESDSNDLYWVANSKDSHIVLIYINKLLELPSITIFCAVNKTVNSEKIVSNIQWNTRKRILMRMENETLTHLWIRCACCTIAHAFT